MTFGRPFTFTSLWDGQRSKEENKFYLTGLDLNCLKGIRISLVMAGSALPRLVPQLILTEDQIILLDLVTPSRNSVLSSTRTGCILEAMTIFFLCQMSFTIR